MPINKIQHAINSSLCAIPRQAAIEIVIVDPIEKILDIVGWSSTHSIQNKSISSNKKPLREMDQSFVMKDHYEILTINIDQKIISK